MSKTQALALAVSLCPVSFVEGCKKPDAVAPQAVASGRSPPARSRASETKESATPMLTKEEVGAILGEPVTVMEGSGGSYTYTADLMHTSVHLGETGSAVEQMAAAHTVNGAGDAAPGLGDEAFFGMMSFLYVRKGNDIFFTIQPPSLQGQAQQKALRKLQGSSTEDMGSAAKELTEALKGDPGQAGMQGTPTEGAFAILKASKHTGTDYEKDSRAMAVALATKLLEKL